MNLDRPVIFFDIEGTGLRISESKIVELAVVKHFPDGSTRNWSQRFNPGIPIPADATAVHGITDADVANCPTFTSQARLIHAGFEGCDLAGYNLHNYDVPLLWEEFARAGIDWDLTGVRIIDAGAIFKKKEPRTLEAAVKRYCQSDHVGAHNALADACATFRVLMGQLNEYRDLAEMPLDELAKYATLDDKPRIDLAGCLVRDGDGDAVFNIGKAKGRKVRDDLGYAEWMLRADFSLNTRFHLERELERIAKAPEPEPLEESEALTF